MQETPSGSTELAAGLRAMRVAATVCGFTFAASTVKTDNGRQMRTKRTKVVDLVFIRVYLINLFIIPQFNFLTKRRDFVRMTPLRKTL